MRIRVCVFVRVFVFDYLFHTSEVSRSSDTPIHFLQLRTPTESLSNSTHLVRLMGVLSAGEELRNILRGVALGDEMMACLIKSAGFAGARSSLFLYHFTLSFHVIQS